MVLIYTTCKDIDEAKELGRKIIKARVAACVNIWPIDSIFFDSGNLKEGSEAVLLIKTNEPKMAEIETFLVKNHSYATPFVGALDVKRLNREYREWMTTVMAP